MGSAMFFLALSRVATVSILVLAPASEQAERVHEARADPVRDREHITGLPRLRGDPSRLKGNKC